VLLNRTTRGVTATEAGEEFYERASRILSELAQAREAAAHQRGKVAGSLRLSAPFTFGVKYVAPVLAELGRDNPNLEIDATCTERRVDLLAEKFDAVIRIGNLEDSSMVSRRISTIQIGAVASPSYLARKGLPITPEELDNHDCLIYTGSSGRPAWRFIDGSNVHTVHPIGRFRADSGAALVAAAEQGVGITVLPHFMLDDAIVSGRLVPLLTNYSLPEQGLFVLRSAGGFVAPKLRAFKTLCAVISKESRLGRRASERRPNGRRCLSTNNEFVGYV